MKVTGETGCAALLLGADQMRRSGYLSDHDMKIAKKLAHVIAGGRVPFGTEVSEEYLLEIEREVFKPRWRGEISSENAAYARQRQTFTELGGCL